MPRPKTLREKIETRIARKKGEDVFLTREFSDLGGEDQVLRALRVIMREGQLVRLGYGVFQIEPDGQAGAENHRRLYWRGATGARQVGREMGADGSPARLQRRPLDTDPRQSSCPREGPLFAAPSLRQFGADT